jgi:hypothetical protein
MEKHVDLRLARSSDVVVLGYCAGQQPADARSNFAVEHKCVSNGFLLYFW